MHPMFKFRRCATAIGLALAAMPLTVHAQEAPVPGIEANGEDGVYVLEGIDVIGTAEETLKQAPGVSTITRQDIEKTPPTNDLSDIIRKMPGVNLTGNSASGQYGNNRQIDLRGMGPENTLILIDGKPVMSRNSIRMGRSGERNTRGDTNWVPAEAVERIEVLRGPAAARYGSGAAGGVVNIITRPPADKTTGSVSVYTNQPHHDEEGDTRRISAHLAGPLLENLSYRLYGNLNRTDADALGINPIDPNATDPDAVPPAGREGVKNRDINLMLRWDATPDHVFELEGGYSRQGNIYAGDRAVSANGTPLLNQLAEEGAETNIMRRRTIALTHRGTWDFGTSRMLFQYEKTDNTRLNEGLAGSVEGSINTDGEFSTSTLDNYFTQAEVNVPFTLGVSQMATVGVEMRNEKLHDPYSMTQGMGTGGPIPGLPTGERNPNSSADNYALYIEDNILATDQLILTPGLRVDHHSKFGTHFSPSLNASYTVTEGLEIKAGIARAFKAPNLYQSNPNYLYYTMGNGCPVDFPSLGTGCYVMGNDDLDPEISLNKEIGISYMSGGWAAGITYFHNDYENKIVSGSVPVGLTPDDGRIFRWDNSSDAIVQGLEGNLTIPLAERWTLTNNFTYMIENDDKRTGQPLSVIPEYTINSWLDWEAREDLTLTVSMTHYGKQEPRNQTMTGAPATGNALKARDPYSIFGISATYDANDHLRVTGGISNIFDERQFRESTGSSAGAATYNEPGRAYYLTLTTHF
ncbi:TonB-dependent siderophore receptor [Telmatospirillum sp. J64-1]|uniref:TonB-dependent siderophore receptor n=1 Tax=Telmatospirillum sp. J64-1 TaxID=2502183 RepID=UPI00115E42C6|nr:TonB-dependent siderophore receptor [Telmatospirillum sp. J64-1]